MAQTRRAINQEAEKSVGATRRRPDTLLPTAAASTGTAGVTPRDEADYSMDEGIELENGTHPLPGSMRRNDDGTVAGTGGLEHLVLRWVAQEALSTETAYEEPKPPLTDILQGL
jgi:hypothetical protein